MPDPVQSYYASFDQNEWQRLTWPEGQLETAVTLHAFERWMPPHARVLDIGGGPGRWSIALAQRGHRVTLADLSPNLLDIARAQISASQAAHNIDDVVEANVCDLSRWADATFDAALCLGPLYHLTDPADRMRAGRELQRVLKPGGIAFVAFMPIYGYLRRTLALKDERHHLADAAFMHDLLEHGIFRNDVPGRFTEGFGIAPAAVAPFMRLCGFEPLALLSDSGYAASGAAHIAELASSDPAAHAAILRTVVDSAADPSTHGSAVHLLFAGRRI